MYEGKIALSVLGAMKSETPKRISVIIEIERGTEESKEILQYLSGVGVDFSRTDYFIFCALNADQIRSVAALSSVKKIWSNYPVGACD